MALLCAIAERSVNGSGTDRLEVSYHSGVEIVLSVAGRELFRGAWGATVTVDGRPVSVAGPWDLELWHADADCDYLEISCLLPNGLRVDRHMLLSRSDRFALLADAVSGAPGTQVEYAARWPFAPWLAAERLGKSRELRLRRGRKALARLFPVGLPQEVTQGKTGSFSSQTGVLELRQSFVGTGLFAPVIIDWHPGRRTLAADWRLLTVTEEERIVPPDRASGYRIRIGGHQLLLYRSLQATDDSRCVLGYHTRFETAVGEFLATGDVRQIMATVPVNSP